MKTEQNEQTRSEFRKLKFLQVIIDRFPDAPPSNFIRVCRSQRYVVLRVVLRVVLCLVLPIFQSLVVKFTMRTI